MKIKTFKFEDLDTTFQLVESGNKVVIHYAGDEDDEYSSVHSYNIYRDEIDNCILIENYTGEIKDSWSEDRVLNGSTEEIDIDNLDYYYSEIKDSFKAGSACICIFQGDDAMYDGISIKRSNIPRTEEYSTINSIIREAGHISRGLRDVYTIDMDEHGKYVVVD